MAKEESPRKLLNVLVYLVLAGLVLGGGYYFTKPYFPNVSNEILPVIPDKITEKFMTPYWADKRFDKRDPSRDKIMLSKDDATLVNDIKIVYRGLHDRSRFRLDVFVLNFDPEMPFAHTLHVDQAKKGFRLADKDFKLISARKHRIHLWHLKNDHEMN